MRCLRLSGVDVAFTEFINSLAATFKIEQNSIDFVLLLLLELESNSFAVQHPHPQSKVEGHFRRFPHN